MILFLIALVLYAGVNLHEKLIKDRQAARSLSAMSAYMPHRLQP